MVYAEVFGPFCPEKEKKKKKKLVNRGFLLFLFSQKNSIEIHVVVSQRYRKQKVTSSIK